MSEEFDKWVYSTEQLLDEISKGEPNDRSSYLVDIEKCGKSLGRSVRGFLDWYSDMSLLNSFSGDLLKFIDENMEKSVEKLSKDLASDVVAFYNKNLEQTIVSRPRTTDRLDIVANTLESIVRLSHVLQGYYILYHNPSIQWIGIDALSESYKRFREFTLDFLAFDKDATVKGRDLYVMNVERTT